MRINKKRNHYIKGAGISSSPSITNLKFFGNNKNKVLNSTIYKNINTFYAEDNVFWTISATESVKIIVNFFTLKNKRKPILALPAYYCNEVIENLNEFCKIKFYDNNDPINSITKILSFSKLDAVLICNYFGVFEENKKFQDLNKYFNGYIIYDNAHLSVPNIEIKNKKVFVIMSIYKHYPVRKVGCLICHKESKFLDYINSFERNNLKDAIFLFKDFILDLLFIFKRILIENINFLSRIRNLDNDPFGENKFKQSSNYFYINKMSFLSKKILNSTLCDPEENLNKKKKSRTKIIELLLWAGININDVIEKDYGIEINISGEYLNILKLLNKSGLPVIRWPKLNRRLIENRKIFNQTQKLWYKKLYIICNGTVSEKKIQLIKKRFQKLYKLNVSFKRIDEENYGNISYGENYSSFLQSKDYVKSQSKDFLFYQIKLQNQTLGKFAICIKRKYGSKLFIINRISLIKENSVINNFSREIIYKELIKFLKSKLDTGILILMPIENIILSRVSRFFFQNILKMNQYETGLICLKNDIESIKKNMKSRWRNSLKNGLKTDINVNFTINQEEIFEIFNAYEEEKKIKRYKGISYNLLKNWYKNSTTGDCKLFGLKASKNYDGKSVELGSIIVCIYQSTATYLLAVTKIKKEKFISNILLWEAIVYAKNNGCTFFDLGGIDKIKTPGVALFKLGLNPIPQIDASIYLDFIRN